MDLPLLSAIVFLPLLAVPLVAAFPRSMPGLARNVSLAFMLATFGLAMYLFVAFNGASAGFQYAEDHAWIGTAVHYRLGVDGISLLLVLLTAFLSPLALLAAYGSVQEKVKEFCLAMLVLECAMLGTFLALDLFLFYVFWELMLLPMYLIIGAWGGPRRIYATVKFVLFTMAGSLLMLVAILYLYLKAGGSTFEYNAVIAGVAAAAKKGLSLTEQVLLFCAFGLAFAIKVPLFPLHTWLPDAHVEAPTAGSVILAGVLLKMGTYGFLRFAIPLFPEVAAMASVPVMALGIIGIIYGSLVAFAQQDVKKLVAYSSVAHLGLVMLGMFTMTTEGVAGSLLQMVNHGVSTGALFLCVGFLYERRHTRMMDDFGGIARGMPFFAAAFLVVVLSSIGLPGTNGFVGELLVLIGVFKEGITSVAEPGQVLCWRNFVLVGGMLAGSGVVLGAVYMLTMVRKVMFGPVTREENRGLRDLGVREALVILPVIAVIFVVGLAPGLVLDKTRASVEAYVQRYDARMTKVRSPATAARDEGYLRTLIEQQIRQNMGGTMNIQDIQWHKGPFDQEGAK